MQQPQFLFPVNKWYRTGSVDENIQSALFSLQQDISHVFHEFLVKFGLQLQLFTESWKIKLCLQP